MSTIDRQEPSRPILVLDGDQASTLAIVRSLGRRGTPVHVGAHVPDALAGFSRFARGRLLYPDPLHDGDAFVEWLASTLSQREFELAIPVTERTVVPIHRNRQRLPIERVAIAPLDALEQVLDKERTFDLAQRIGIPIPRSRAVSSLDEALTVAASLGYPVVVKPTRSVGTAGEHRVQLTVAYAQSAEQLVRQVTHQLRHGGVILQEYFRGDGVGVEVIADRGAVTYAFQHRRLHEVPLTGGGSSLRVSESVTPELGRATEALMAALGWHGVAMAEFKHHRASGEYRLMEVNGRFWGSLPLAIAAGADFPALLHELMTTGRTGTCAVARSGIVCRNLSRDIDWLEHVLRRAVPPGLAPIPSTASVLRDTLLTLSPRHRFDVQSLDDLRPGWIDLTRIAGRQWQRVAGSLARRWRLVGQRWAVRAGGPGNHRVRTARRVLFLCYGNINRSALAHAHAMARYGGTLAFESAGFHAEENRPADPAMVEVAGHAGVDLSRWQSRTVTPDMVRHADLILAMELTHLQRLTATFPDADGKCFLLGAPNASTGGPAEILDPYGQPPARYQEVCRQVMTAVDAWMRQRRSGPTSAPTETP